MGDCKINVRLMDLKEFMNIIKNDTLNDNINPQQNWNIIAPAENVAQPYPLDLLQDNKLGFSGVFGNPWRNDDLFYHWTNMYNLNFLKDDYINTVKKENTYHNFYSLILWHNSFRPVFEFADNDNSVDLHY